ncbi:GL20564 [Drosophila persimilis]|uniref:GL20564 n=1 Tax=Drosophila persimilis TaxID=7234 RepID=B4GWJ2_DROPE|nr:GL20564 [Drosophila persimilis]
MTWEPQGDGLQQIIAILKESQSPDTATQMAGQGEGANGTAFKRRMCNTNQSKRLAASSCLIYKISRIYGHDF